MKLVKLKIARNHTFARTRYSYPAEYDPTKVVFGPIYESSLTANFNAVVARGDTDEFIIFGVADAEAPDFLANVNAEELTYAKTLELGNAWTQQVEKILDPVRVISICAKVVRGEVLTQQEINALDSDSKESGVNKSKAFKDCLDEALAK